VPSFDIVSKLDLAEVDNAIAGINREIATRFDFKGSKCTVERKESEIELVADDELKLKQLHELLKVHLTRRKIEPGALDYQKPEKASGNTLRQGILLRQGIDAALAKQLVREVKDSKLKVQAAVQGGEVRITGKKRDDLQAAITLIRDLKIEQPLQYVNFRE
jgi:cyclic-di-GMP-binding protein